MSTIEKTIDLLRAIPESDLEMIYAFLQFRLASYEKTERKHRLSAFGIAHAHADPDLIPLEKEAYADAMEEKHSFN